MNTEVDIEQRLEALARTPVLLVATDYDGTLAPIVEEYRTTRPAGRFDDLPANPGGLRRSGAA